MKRITTVSFVIAYILIVQVVDVDASQENEILNLINKYFYSIEQSDFSGASDLFHYPPSYSQEELIKDKSAVSKFLESLSNSFGQLSNPVTNKAEEKILSLQVGGGNIPYWKKHPKYVSSIYRATFSKFGEGFVTFTICNLSNKYEIREVKYGLSASSNNSVAMLQGAFKTLHSVFGENN
jgi:hypothetical protein